MVALLRVAYPFTMRGIDGTTGKPLEGIQHLRQSIGDILSTRIGTRVMRRDYGSRIPELIDAPLNASTKVELIAATAEAIGKWEPRFALKKVTVVVFESGTVELDLEGEYWPEGKTGSSSGEAVTLDGVKVTA